MAIANTGAMFKTLTFDGQSLRNYGVYITGEAVYNAPEREIEMVSIPNRNGAFALDKGRFENIEVTYPAGVFANSESDFAEGISDLRNLLCSKRGYCRLVDDYNPNEYRMAIYKSGLEVEPSLLRAGEFEITFECMPQRFLISGENPVSMTSGDTITNPTLFDAKPMVEVEGYGEIDLNGYGIDIENALMGDILLKQGATFVKSVSFDTDLLNSSDPITIKGITMNFNDGTTYQIKSLKNPINSKSETSAQCGAYKVTTQFSAYKLNRTFEITSIDFTFGTIGNVTITGQITTVDSNNTEHSEMQIISITYDGDSTITFVAVRKGQPFPWSASNYTELWGNSSKSALGNPTYLDCDTGDCYKIVNDEYVSLNHVIDLGSNLPVLNPGSNTVTYDNTITDLQIIPRWWQI